MVNSLTGVAVTKASNEAMNATAFETPKLKSQRWFNVVIKTKPIGSPIGVSVLLAKGTCVRYWWTFRTGSQTCRQW
jgi:hypothetical protein